MAKLLPTAILTELSEALPQLLGRDLIEASFDQDELTVLVNRESIGRVMQTLRDDSRWAFVQLVDIAGVDYPAEEERFEVVYHLLSMQANLRIRVKVRTDEETPVPSIVGVFSTAGWFEREAWDMYGIFFAGNPDLRRILTDYGFEGHPLRKDFPLTGHVELRYDNAQKRVVYEPVKLKQDFRNFDNLSPWEGMTSVMLPGDEKAAIPFGAKGDPRIEDKKQ